VKIMSQIKVLLVICGVMIVSCGCRKNNEEVAPPTELSVRWDKTLSSGLTFDTALTAATRLKGSDVILVGLPATITKMNSSGVKLWSKQFVNTSSQTHDVKIISVADGGFLLGMTALTGTDQYKTANGQGGNDFWIMKYNSDGEKLWDKAYGGNSNEILTSMCVLSDGSIAVIGSSTSPISGQKTALGNCWILKLNSDGDKIWDRSLQNRVETKNITPIAGGGFFIGGNVLVNSTPLNYGWDYSIQKFDSNGTILWDNSFGGNRDDDLTAVVGNADGGCTIGGTSRSTASRDKSEGNRSTNQEEYYQRDYWILKIDSNGKRIWDKTFGGNSYDDLSFVLTYENGFLLGGTSASGTSSDKTSDSKGSSDYWIIKIDDKGRKIWDRTIGGNQGEDLTIATIDSNNGLCLFGRSTSKKSGDKSNDDFGFWIVYLTY
jgi:hypothetical protein